MMEPKLGDYIDAKRNGDFFLHCKVIVLDKNDNTIKIIVPDDFERGTMFDNIQLYRDKRLNCDIINNPEFYYDKMTYWVKVDNIIKIY